MSSIRTFIGRKTFVTVPFMGEEVQIARLTLGQVMEIQKRSAAIKEDDPTGGLEVMKFAIRSSVENGESLTDDEFAGFAMADLAKLSEAIMAESGAGGKADTKN